MGDAASTPAQAGNARRSEPGPGRAVSAARLPQDDPGFPGDSTGDQRVNSAQFDAYQQLGHFIGQAAAQRQENPLPGGA